jgi:hypothetical protein
VARYCTDPSAYPTTHRPRRAQPPPPHSCTWPPPNLPQSPPPRPWSCLNTRRLDARHLNTRRLHIHRLHIRRINTHHIRRHPITKPPQHSPPQHAPPPQSPPTRIAPACYRPNAHCLHPRPPAASTRSSNVSHLHSAHMHRATTLTTKCPNTLPPQPPPHYLSPPRLTTSTPERLPALQALKLPDKFFICLFSPFFPHLTLNWSRRPSLPSRARSCHDATPTNVKTMAMRR